MRHAGKLLTAVTFACASLLTLTGCSGNATAYDNTAVDQQASTAWFQSSLGDVNCLYTNGSYGRHRDVTCDWSTLTTRGSHTTTKSPTLQIKLITTNRGTVQCGISVDSDQDGYQTPTCNWSTLTSLTGGAR